MSCNVGMVDRIIRIVAGIALIVVAVVFSEPIAYVGVIPLLTGLIGFCPAYFPFKINSGCKKQ